LYPASRKSTLRCPAPFPRQPGILRGHCLWRWSNLGWAPTKSSRYMLPRQLRASTECRRRRFVTRTECAARARLSSREIRCQIGQVSPRNSTLCSTGQRYGKQSAIHLACNALPSTFSRSPRKSRRVSRETAFLPRSPYGCTAVSPVTAACINMPAVAYFLFHPNHERSTCLTVSSQGKLRYTIRGDLKINLDHAVHQTRSGCGIRKVDRRRDHGRCQGLG